MGQGITIILFLLLTCTTAKLTRALPHISVIRRQSNTSGNATADIVNALRQNNLASLAGFFDSHPTVLEQVTSSPGLKTMLAPTDAAMAGIPDWCTGNTTCFEGLMLMHILNGSFTLDQLARAPMHTVGHSFLTDQTYVHLPGNNGQAVALNLASDGSQYLNSSNRFVPTSAQIVEAQNSNTFDTVAPITVASMTIAPVRRAMTIPGGPLETLDVIGKFSLFTQMLRDENSGLAASIRDMRGVTIFAPTNRAVRAYQNQGQSQDNTSMSTILRNHLVANRAVYSPLLQAQGNMTTMAGQSIAFDEVSRSVAVGGKNATVSQLDIMHSGGVIHAIDAVLADTSLDAAKASQAATDASASAVAGIAGPVNPQNSASSSTFRAPYSAQPNTSTSPSSGQKNGADTISDTLHGMSALIGATAIATGLLFF